MLSEKRGAVEMLEGNRLELERSSEGEFYREGAMDLSKRLIPPDIFDCQDDLVARVRFLDLLPVVQCSSLSQAPCSFSVLLLCKHRENSTSFFYDIISRFLLPHRRPNVELFFTSDVRLPALSDERLSVAEIIIQIKSFQEIEEVRRNWKQIETEIRLGVVSLYHARRIMEFKGLSSEGKTAMIQEKISSLIRSRSKDFDRNIFSEMQQFLITCHEEFKKVHDYHHISRIISNLHSLRQFIRQNVQAQPHKRHIIIKLLKTKLLHNQTVTRPVLGILVGFNFLQEHEIFEKEHIAESISRCALPLRIVDNSFFVDPAHNGLFQSNYIEVEKEDDSEFSMEEIQKLRLTLPDQIESHIEHLTHPVFMPRNEEEVLRNIMTLSRQIRFVSDMPQVIISFDEQRGSQLCYTIVLVRVIGTLAKPVCQMIDSSHSSWTITPDRVRILGTVGRKYSKEATVFRLTFPHSSFLRPDHSVDLYRAREWIVSELGRIFGQVRDYNGGMLGKQSAAFSEIKKLLGRIGDRHHVLLEKFFFALSPVELRSIIEPETFKQLFMLLLQSVKTAQAFHKRSSDLLFKLDNQKMMILVRNVDPNFKMKAIQAIDSLQVPLYQLITFTLAFHDTSFVGFLWLCDNPSEQKRFFDAIEHLNMDEKHSCQI